ncbi:hypothetical protein FRB99_000376 [Tulasnella sp. 403]|nr:hypothetical protein FRB99_000376 [Tulasnella sp. 403]
MYKNSTLCVPRGGNLHEAVVVDSEITLPIPPEHVLVKVDKFGWSANNVTYGILGEDPHFRYFEFHPAPKTRTTSPKTHGIIPVWGYGTIVESQVGTLKVGERVAGYFPSAKYMLVKVDTTDVNSHNFHAARPHLPPDRRPYNQITRCAADHLYRSEEEDAAMLYRPLFWTSFWAEDWLDSMDYRGAKAVIISSASSKTGFCLALVIKRRLAKTAKKLRVVGLTSPTNKQFVDSLGLYDEVLLYDDLTNIGIDDGPYCYVDVAGNASLNSRIVTHLGSSFALGVTLGMSHASKESIKDSAAKKSKFEMFFMPEWLYVVRKRTSVQRIAERQKEGWKWIMEDGARWVKMKRVMGSEDVLDEFKKTLKGGVAPDTGLVFSLWDDKTNFRAKL